MAFQYKTLIRVAPAALLILAFQNCAPQKFAQTTAASEKSFVDDGTSDVPADGSTDVPVDGSTASMPPTDTTHSQHDGDCNDGTKTSDNGKNSDEDGKQPNHDGKQPSQDGRQSDQQRASNCKDLAAKFIAMKIKPAAMSKIDASGQTSVGPFFVSGVDKIDSTGSSDVYIVGSDANAMAKEIRASGLGHVVLCGVYAGNTRVSGNGVVDVIGANVLGEVKPSGRGTVNVLDQDGKPL